jgi:hypothetical protein
MEKKFEFAVRNKVRFPFRGMISVEDLWDLSVESLDTVYKALNKQKKQADEESLLETKTSEDVMLDTQLAIVKYIFETKVAEINARKSEQERKEYNQKIMAIIASKEEQALQDKSIDELKKMLS